MPSEQLSESSHSTSTGRRSNSSDNSSVVYKPSTDNESNRATPVSVSKFNPSVPENAQNNPERTDSPHDGEDGSPMRITPMRPLLRGYAATLTLPSRTSDVSHCDASLSDGEVSNLAPGALESHGGYMSEGGDSRANNTQLIRQQLVNG